MKPNAATKVLFILLAFNGRFNPSILAATKQIHDTFSFLCQDQMVKVDSNIYHLDRLNSSLKSEYFEKLFTSEDFKQKNDPTLEIQSLNSEVFPAILEIIHGKEIRYVLNKDNYLSLLMEMNHFGMEIDLKCFLDLIDLWSLQNAEMCELYAFIIHNNQKFGYLLISVLKYFSNHLDELQNHKILSFDVPLDHLIQIIENIDQPDENTRHNVIQMCSKWLCHDMKNRLPLMGRLARKTKSLYYRSEDMHTDFSKCLPSCDVDEQAKQKVILTCFSALVANQESLESGEKFHATTPEYNYDSCARYYQADPNDGSETETEEYERYVNDRDDCDKLNEFRRNGELYDITVRVGEKTYKLHRRVLESKSGHFRDIFQAEYAEAITQCGGIPTTCPSKDKEYLLSDEIDPSIFEDVISSLYGYVNLHAIFQGFLYKWYRIAQFFKIVHLLQLYELLDDSIRDLKEEHQRWSSQDVEEILNFAHGKPEYDNLYVICLRKHLKENWPNIRNMSQFCSISLPVLKKMLNSSHFQFDDPHKILDICSKWTCHDVKGRYQYLPQIARAINPLCAVEDDKYITEAVADFNTLSEKFVRDELWKILSSLSYTFYSEKYFKNTSRKLEEIPVFISVTEEEKKINVLNADLDVITSINDTDPSYAFWRTCAGRDDPLMATLINDNLFILSDCFGKCSFMVYNFFLKTCIQLRCDLPIPRSHGYQCCFYTLLNCNNEIYSCSMFGRIAKYSMQFDLWTTLIKQDPQLLEKENLHYTSDGKTLYRMYGTRYYRLSSPQYVVEEFDLRRNSWSRVPGSPLTKNLNRAPTCFSMINDRDFVIFVSGEVITSNRDVTGKEWHWSYHDIPNEGLVCFAQYEDRLLLTIGVKFYRYYPTNGSLEFKKNIKTDLRLYRTLIVPIDRHVFIGVATRR